MCALRLPQHPQNLAPNPRLPARNPPRNPNTTPDEPDWVETVLRSHDNAVVDDLFASLELGGNNQSGGEEGPPRFPNEEENVWTDQGVPAGGGFSGGGGAVLVHGPPGVGKTCLVRRDGMIIGWCLGGVAERRG